MKSRYLLSNIKRLKKKKDFNSFFSKSKRLDNRLFSLYYSKHDQKEPKVAFVSSKKSGIAIVRNRCKRLLRESVRLNQEQLLTMYNYVLVSKRSMKESTLSDVSTEFVQVFDRLKRREQ